MTPCQDAIDDRAGAIPDLIRIAMSHIESLEDGALPDDSLDATTMPDEVLDALGVTLDEVAI